MRAVLRLGLVALIFAPVTAAGQAGGVEKPATAARVNKTVLEARRVTVAPGKSVIRGTAVNESDVPLPGKFVRLRNLETSTIEEVSVTDRLGVFNFVALPETPYVVEIIDQPGGADVIAVGRVIIARAGEVVGDVIIVPAALPTHGIGFKSAAGAVLSALSGTGLTAFEPGTPPLSPEK
jgi:hypothetical protein